MQSSAAKRLDYSGSIAYDLSRFDKRKRVREALEREPVVAPRAIARPQERAKAEAVTRTRKGVSLATVLGCMVVAVLMFFIVLNYMRLYEISMQVSSVKSQYATLKNDAAVLQVKAEKQMSVRRIEELASEIGMSSPENSQIVYINMSQPDRGQVILESGRNSDFLTGLQAVVFTVVDFLK